KKPFGGLAIPEGPMALRPTLADGLPFRGTQQTASPILTDRPQLQSERDGAWEGITTMRGTAFLPWHALGDLSNTRPPFFRSGAPRRAVAPLPVRDKMSPGAFTQGGSHGEPGHPGVLRGPHVSVGSGEARPDGVGLGGRTVHGDDRNLPGP